MMDRRGTSTLSGTHLGIVCYDRANLHICMSGGTRRTTVISLLRGQSGAWEPVFVSGKPGALRNAPLALQLVADLTGDCVIMADNTYRQVVPE